MYREVQDLPEPQSPEEAQANKDLRWELLRSLFEEQRNVLEEYQIFSCEHLDFSRTAQDALLAPSAREWPVMIRQKNAVDQQIERKLRLLIHLQEDRRKREPRKRA